MAPTRTRPVSYLELVKTVGKHEDSVRRAVLHLFSWNQADVGGFCGRMHTPGYQGFLCGTGLFEMLNGQTEGQHLARVVALCLSGYLSVVLWLVRVC